MTFCRACRSRIRLSVVIVACVSVCIAMGDAGSARRAIEAQEGKFTKGFKSRDSKAIAALMAPECISETAKGKKLTRAQEVDSLSQLFKVIQKVEVARTKIIAFKMTKGIATVNCENTINATIQGPEGKPGRLVVRNKSLEVWTLKNGRWLLHYAKELPGGSTTLDGKVQTEE